MPKTPYKISPSQVLFQRKQEGVLPLTYSEWRRIKTMAGKIKCPSDLFHTLGAICIGLFTSSIITFFTFNDNTKDWCIITMICICILSGVLSFVFLTLHYKQRNEITVLGQNLIDEMEAIEKSFETPITDGTEYPLQ